MTRPKRGTYVINEFGRRLVEEFPHGFTEKDLIQRVPGNGPGPGIGLGGDVGEPPPPDVLNSREQIAAGVERLRLGELMVRYGVGVQVRDTYTVVELDENYFEH